MVDTKEPESSRFRTGAELFVVLALVLIATGLVLVIVANLGTSADIRKESSESHFLAEMQIALTTVEEAVAAWQLDPTRPHPSIDPEIATAVEIFHGWRTQMAELVDSDEVPVVLGFSAALDRYVQAAANAPATAGPDEMQELIGLGLEARRPLLELLGEENDHLQESVEADRRAEQWLRWGAPTLLILALLVLTGLFRVRDRGRQLAEQRKINAAQTEFIGSVSHELRTPLTSVVAYSHELRERFDDFSQAEIQEMVSALVQESDEVAAIVDDLLVAARLKTDHLVINAQVLDVREEIDHALETIGDVGDVEIEATGSVLADRGRLRQILRNLLSNARRYGGDQIRISSAVRQGQMLIVVADSGPAVPAKLHTEIFEPFISIGDANGATTAVGLGLSVSRNLATIMGGTLSYSHEDGWSRMNLALPVPTATGESRRSDSSLRATPVGG